MRERGVVGWDGFEEFPVVFGAGRENSRLCILLILPPSPLGLATEAEETRVVGYILGKCARLGRIAIFKRQLDVLPERCTYFRFNFRQVYYSVWGLDWGVLVVQFLFVYDF